MLAFAKFQTRECKVTCATASARPRKKPGIARLHRYNLLGSDPVEKESNPFSQRMVEKTLNRPAS
jgi:hypothetical protein